jgi:hypothetical protein
MSEQGYNGYSNYETWNVCLWMANDEPLYRSVIRNAPFTADEAEAFTRDLFPDGTPDFDSVEDFDLVDWDEVAQDYNEMAGDS